MRNMTVWSIQSYFIFFSLLFSHKTCALSQPACPHDQSLALIQFNNSFSIGCDYRFTFACNATKAKTMWWKEGTSCCLWEGVTCDAETGDVIGLDLSCSCLVGTIPSNSTLFLLRHLRRLNLAHNDFSQSLIASQFGQLTGLTHLNISQSGFAGEIPLEISHLFKLSSLDLSANDGLVFEGHVFENVVGNLTQLRHLLLSDVDMSLVEPTSFLNMSSYITTLTLKYSGLKGKFPEDVFRFPCLEEFRFTGNLGEQKLEVKFPMTNWSGGLKSLEVAYAYVQELPDSIGNLRSLEILDLSYSNVRGPIPANLVNLTQLKFLDLTLNFLTGPVLFSFSHFKHLTFLDLSGNNLEGQVSDSFGNLTKLFHLSFSGNKLSGVFPVSVFNLPQVEILDLSGNKLVGSFPSQISGLSRLVELHLDDNFLGGRVPSWLFILPSLEQLWLNNNRLTGSIDQFDKVAPLKSVDLSNNEIEGPIPASFFQLVNLTVLDLSSNNLSGSFELDILSNLSTLWELDLSNNPLLSFTSASSNANYSLTNLSRLNLSCCNASEFPNFVRNLQGLTDLDLSHNRIRVIEADMFLKLKSLESLYLSHNSPLSLTNNNNLTLVLPNLGFLSLASCNITEFSNFLTMQGSLSNLDLSNNSIQGQITKQERNWGSNLTYLDFSNNLLTAVEYYPWKNIFFLNLGSNLLEGPLLLPPPSINVFLISNNRLNGEIPSSICSFELDSAVIDLSRNNLSGAIPKCLGWAKLWVLDLQMNHFHGNIPEFCVNGGLHTLNLNHNEFDGTLPKSLAQCFDLEVLNLGNNKINDTFPYWLGTLPQLRVLVLRANCFHGQIIRSENGSEFSTLRILDLSRNEFSGLLPTTYFESFQGMMSSADVQRRYMGYDSFYYHDSMVVTMKGVDVVLERILTIFATLDMSSNRFQGTIPKTVGELVSLQVLNFSHNHLTGHIPSSLGNVSALESLDLSCNKLVGEIPSHLAGLNFLEVLNLSENQLVGLIPQGKQFGTFLKDSYAGNSGLCGFPVSKGCDHSEPPPATFDEQEADSTFGLDWKFVMMGYGYGMVFGFSAGYIMMTVRKPKWLVGMIQRAGNKVVRRFKKYS